MSSPVAQSELPDGGKRRFDVVCLGHALVDRLAEASPEVVRAAGLEPGAMTLVDGSRAAQIEQLLDAWQEVAGGSAANTAAGIASLGGSPAFAGSVGDDEPGRRYVADLEANGVHCVAHAVTSGNPTGVCHVLVGPSGDRSMATSLGAAGELSPAAVEEVGIGDASIVYVEGYLLDAPAASSALKKAVELARGAGTLVSLSLSDPFVAERHRDRILELIGEHTIDVLFGNEEEALSLTGTTSLDEALEALTLPGLLTVVTLGAAGSVAASPAGRIEARAHRVEAVVDTTGAGDLFAAGVLFGITTGRDMASALGIGSIAASEVISHLGARPQKRLSTLARSE